MEENNMAKEVKYFVSGGLVKCNRSKDPNKKIKMIATTNSRIGNMLGMTEIDVMDASFEDNFGYCNMLSKGDNLVKCRFSTLPKWMNVNNKYATEGGCGYVTMGSFLVCKHGGAITPVTDGQILETFDEENDRWYRYREWGIIQEFAAIYGGSHLAVDINNGDNKIKAVFKGTILNSKNSVNDNIDDGKMRGQGNGNSILMEHNIDGKTFYSSYNHLKRNSIKEHSGEIDKGTHIADMGHSGKSSTPHLHLIIYTVKGSYTTSPAGYTSDWPSIKVIDSSTDYITIDDGYGRIIRFYNPISVFNDESVLTKNHLGG
jgi:hypothetical protein